MNVLLRNQKELRTFGQSGSTSGHLCSAVPGHRWSENGHGTTRSRGAVGFAHSVR